MPQAGRPSETIVIKAGLGRKVGLLAAAAFMFVAGLYCATSDDIVLRLLGLFIVGAIVIGGPYTAWKMSRGIYVTTLSPEGLQLGTEAPVIPWSDIEGFGIHDQGNRQVYTTVALSSYASWMRHLTPAQVRRVVAVWKASKFVGPAMAALQVGMIRSPADLLNIKDAAESWDLMEGSEEIRDLASALAFSRKKYGGELLIAPMQRDRSAEDLAQLLADYRTSQLA